MFSRSAAFYDAVYAFKDYAAEAAQVHARIQDARPGASTLLDVACGTGKHLEYLVQHYEAEGLDLDPELLAVAQRRLPKVRFHLEDMRDFTLEKTYDVVTCLFSAIGYVQTVERLGATLLRFAAHLNPGGVLLLEPWLTPDVWEVGRVHVRTCESGALKVVRMNTTARRGRLAVMDMHYLVGEPSGVEHVSELHELGLFSREEYEAAFAGAGLEVLYDSEGLTGRGLYLGRKPEG